MEIKQNELEFKTAQPGFPTNLVAYHEYQADNQVINDSICFFYEMRTSSQSIKAIPIIPDGCMDLIFVSDNTKVQTYLIGTASSLVGLDAEKNKYIFGIRFLPGGIKNFFPVSAGELNSCQIPFEIILPSVAKTAEIIQHTTGFESKIELAANFLLKNEFKKREKDFLLRYCVSSIISSGGSVTINGLSSTTGYSTRYINRLFHEYVGLSPKRFGEVIRLQNTIRFIQNNIRVRFSAVSSQCGYYDQSHMNRVLGRFLGVTASYIGTDDCFTASRQHLKKVYHF